MTFGIEDIGAGIVLDAEDALGLDSSMRVLKGDFLYRFGSSRRHNFSFVWSSYHRDATRELLKDKEINGKPIPAGTDLYSKFNIDIFKAGYTYSFFHDDRMNLSFGGGLYVMPIEIKHPRRKQRDICPELISILSRQAAGNLTRTRLNWRPKTKKLRMIYPLPLHFRSLW